MSHEAEFGGLGGGAAGAIAGGLIGGPVGASLGFAIGQFGGSTIGGLFGGRNEFDPTQALQSLASFYEARRVALVRNVNKSFNQIRSRAAHNLAARGVLTSPVSQNTFGQISTSRGEAIADAEATLAAEQARARTQILGQQQAFNFQEGRRQQSISASRAATVGGLAQRVLKGFEEQDRQTDDVGTLADSIRRQGTLAKRPRFFRDIPRQEDVRPQPVSNIFGGTLSI